MKNQQGLPTADIYDHGVSFMPWAELIRQLECYLLDNIPRKGSVVDMMCGPGNLIGALQAHRPDLNCFGVDHNDSFISYVRRRHRKDVRRVKFVCEDVFRWQPTTRFDAIVCSGGVHHLPDDMQLPFLEKLSNMLRNGGFAIIADPYIGNYRTERERLLRSAELGYEYLSYVIKRKAPPEVIDFAVQILRNDVLLIEWKTSVSRRMKMLKQYFRTVRVHKVWPKRKSDFGDYYFIVRN